MWNGLMAVCYQLSDVSPGEGGYACIPGSHRANYSCPDDVRRLETHSEWFKNLPMKAGSALVFTEALTHGTLPWKGLTSAGRCCTGMRRETWFTGPNRVSTPPGLQIV